MFILAGGHTGFLLTQSFFLFKKKADPRSFLLFKHFFVSSFGNFLKLWSEMVSYNCTMYHRSDSISIVFSPSDKTHHLPHSVEEDIPTAPLLLFTEAGTVANVYRTAIT